MLKYFLSFIFLITTSVLWSQEIQQKKLEEQKAKIQKEIRENETKLKRLRKGKNSYQSHCFTKQ